MIMLIATVCIIIATVAAGVQAAKIRGGFVPEKFAGNAAEFLMRKRKEYAMLAWVGTVCGPLFLVIAALEWGKPGAYERIAYGVLLLICGAVMFALRAQLPTKPVAPK
jgi:di/tricarboxylate transporter